MDSGFKKKSKLNKSNGFDIFNNVLMAVFAFVTLFPFYYVIIISLAKLEDIQKHLIYVLPLSMNFNAYELILKEKLFMNSFFISVFITVAGTFLSMLVSTAAAYTLSKKDIPGAKAMFAFVLVPLFFSGGLIPYYLTVKAVGLINNVLVMIIPSLVSTFYLILIKNFFEEMPASIEESAKIDGANDIYILYKIILPTSAPVIATISIFYAVDRWNEYYNAMLFISSRNLHPLQLVLRNILLNFTQMSGSSIGQAIKNSRIPVYTKSLQMAIIVVATVPILCVYPFLQKHFTKGILFGAVKE